MTITTEKNGRNYTVKASQGPITFTATSVSKVVAFKRAIEGAWKYFNQD